jgi:hypothetical protein
MAPGIFSPLHAQSGQRRVENRLLLVFDTSSAMKKRVPTEVKAVDQLFELTLNGKLRPGDSVGIWTFSRDLHMGQFPQQEWSGDKINTLPPQIAAFLKKQRYSKDTRFDQLIPTLNEVVKTSPRLTTIIFCDGDGQVQGIPGADTINSSFKEHQRQMEKAHVPFVIVLRSQFGKYIGCTISSAESVNLPTFPKLPPPVPAPAPTKAAPEPSGPVAAPLIVIGTHTETNQTPAVPPPATPPRQPAPFVPQPPAPVPAPPVKPTVPPVEVPPAVSPAPAIPMAHTNSIPPPVAPIQPTNAMVVPPPAPAQTPPPIAAKVMPPEKAATNIDGFIAAGAGLIVVVAITFFILRRARGRNSASLITESLKKDKIHS